MCEVSAKILHCRVVGARHSFQIFRQNTWFLEDNRAVSKFLYGILHYLISIIKLWQDQSIQFYINHASHLKPDITNFAESHKYNLRYVNLSMSLIFCFWWIAESYWSQKLGQFATSPLNFVMDNFGKQTLTSFWLSQFEIREECTDDDPILTFFKGYLRYKSIFCHKVALDV